MVVVMVLPVGALIVAGLVLVGVVAGFLVAVLRAGQIAGVGGVGTGVLGT